MNKVADLVSCPKSKSDYCLNGGTCYVTLTGKEETLCSCTLPYYGARCDRIVTDSMEFKKLRRQFLDRTLTVAGIVITFIVLFLILIISWYISWRRRQDLQNWKRTKRQSQRYKTVQVNLLPDPATLLRMNHQDSMVGPSSDRPAPKMVSIGVNTCFQGDRTPPSSSHMRTLSATVNSPYHNNSGVNHLGNEDDNLVNIATQENAHVHVHQNSSGSSSSNQQHSYSRFNSYPPPPPNPPGSHGSGHHRVSSMPGVSMVAPNSPSVFAGMSPSKTAAHHSQSTVHGSPYSTSISRYQPPSILRNHHHSGGHHNNATNHLSQSPARPPNLLGSHASYQPPQPPHSSWLDEGRGLDDHFYISSNHHEPQYYHSSSHHHQQVISPLLHHQHSQPVHHSSTGYQQHYRNHQASLRVASEHDALLNELIDRGGYAPTGQFTLSRTQDNDFGQHSFSGYSGRSGIY